MLKVQNAQSRMWHLAHAWNSDPLCGRNKGLSSTAIYRAKDTFDPDQDLERKDNFCKKCMERYISLMIKKFREEMKAHDTSQKPTI